MTVTVKVDHNLVKAALSLFEESVGKLMSNGWTPKAEEGPDPWYWWVHARLAGTFSLGAALRKVHEWEVESGK